MRLMAWQIPRFSLALLTLFVATCGASAEPVREGDAQGSTFPQVAQVPPETQDLDLNSQEMIDLLQGWRNWPRDGFRNPPTFGDARIPDPQTLGLVDRTAIERLTADPKKAELFEKISGGNLQNIDNAALHMDVVRWINETDMEIVENYRRELLAAKNAPDIVSPYQVLPGVPVVDPGMAKTQCSGAYCGRKSPPDFLNEIRYESGAHAEVVPFETSADGLSWHRTCSAFLISPRHALTALHCFGTSGAQIQQRLGLRASALDGWSTGIPNDERFFSFAVQGDIGDWYTRYLVEDVHIPYSSTAPPAHAIGAPPRVDLALFRFSPPAPDLPVAATLGRETAEIGEAVTFSGFGRTTVTDVEGGRYAAFNTLIGVETVNGVDYLLWKSGDKYLNGGPCDGDSGGPMYLGFERGYKDDLNTVIGIVSSLDVPEVTNAFSCLYREGRAVDVTGFLPDICALAKGEPRACR